MWIKVQESLERNKNKAYHKPRNNEALLTGLLYCSCGNRMYPKLTPRKTAEGKSIYTYVCHLKERSQRAACNNKNANGNAMDTEVIEQIKTLAKDNDTFITQLEQSRKLFTGNRETYGKQLTSMKQKKAEIEQKIEGLVDTLADLSDGAAKNHVAKRIEQLSQESIDIRSQIHELENLTSQNTLSDIEFDIMRRLLTIFKDSIDEMSVEQKRTTVRTIIQKVVWDGENAHVILSGVRDDEIKLPKTHWGDVSK